MLRLTLEHNLATTPSKKKKKKKKKEEKQHEQEQQQDTTTTTTTTTSNNRTIEINLKEQGLSIGSIADTTVAANSLEEKTRTLSSNTYEACISKISELQQRRTNLPPNNKSAKIKLTEQINQQIDSKIQERDQMLGRPPQQGWLRLRLKRNNTSTTELIFSPIEKESSFFSSSNESERGKKENYQNNYEQCRQVMIDSMEDTIGKKKDLKSQYIRPYCKTCTNDW